MIHFRSSILLATVIVFAFYLPAIDGAPFTVSDDRIRNLDSTPLLGRGYSVGTNTFQSTCLMIDEVHSPSYNYDYQFTDFSKSQDVAAALTGKVSATFAYWKVKEEIAVGAKTSGKSITKTRMIVSTMRIERYYSSIREELSPMSDSALTLLDTQDYIGFFKSCGPNYVRSIRRAQELTAIFKFTSASVELANAFALDLKAQSNGHTNIGESFALNTKYSSITNNLAIITLGYGLGLNKEGLSTLVSATLDEYNDVMRFAFKSFTQNDDASNIGMVYAIEVVPWVDNTAFQVASKILDEEVELPLSRSLIPKATMDGSEEGWDNNDEFTRDMFQCEESYYEIDMYGYCCERTSLYNPVLEKYEYDDLTLLGVNTELVCNPVRKLDKSVLKNNMSSNGEFAARLDTIVRARLNHLFTLEKCIIAANVFEDRYDYYLLKAQDSAMYDASVEDSFTVKDLKMALDPLEDYGLLKQVGQEIDEFVEMYYQPCIAALFGSDIGNSPDVEPQYFMAYGWITHDACMKLSCLAENMRWDRKNSGCVPSVITGSNSGNFGSEEEGDADFCAKDDAVRYFFDTTERCKFPEIELKTFKESASVCWGNYVPLYLMDHFCMPRMTGTVGGRSVQESVMLRSANCPVDENRRQLRTRTQNLTPQHTRLKRTVDNISSARTSL